MRPTSDGMIASEETVMSVTRRPTTEEYEILDAYRAAYTDSMHGPPVGLHYIPDGPTVYFSNPG